ncbi:helix-turn-helix transcriptional regulator [Enterococcus sp. S22(2020)]|nr:helix-turn-helix transcriptional regulator [Enterococcus sp. S23]MCA5017844.1 helix-turn-helix transcriptional regulator [Enterococcus sp. S22(2020)]
MANNIKEVREGQGIGRSKLAEEVGISYHTLYRLEKHEYIPTLLAAFDIATALNKTIDELFIFDE